MGSALPWVLIVDGVFAGRAGSAGELMRRNIRGHRVLLKNEATGACFYRAGPDRRLKYHWHKASPA